MKSDTIKEQQFSISDASQTPQQPLWCMKEKDGFNKKIEEHYVEQANECFHYKVMGQ